MNEDLKRKIVELERDLRIAKRENDALKIREVVWPLAFSAGIGIGAIEDVLLRAERAFTIDTEKRIRDSNGLSPAEWFRELKVNASHLWASATDAPEDADKSKPPIVNGDNPWSAKSWNLTKQGEYLRKHGEAKAEQMAKAAGCKGLDDPRPPKG